MVEGLGESKKSKLGELLKKIGKRWFVVREMGKEVPTLLYPRHAMSYLRGPMTTAEIARVVPR